jgi:hypothetical protein
MRKIFALFMLFNIRRQNLCTLVLTAFFLLFLSSTNGQISMTASPTFYSQNFNSLNNNSSGTNVTWTDNTTLPGWYTNGQSTYRTYSPGDAVPTNRIWSTGSAAGNTDRSLGSLMSSTTIRAWGLQLKNNTGATLPSITIGFDALRWYLGGTGSNFKVQYSTSSTNVGDAVASANWTSIATITTQTTGLSYLLSSINLSPNATITIRFISDYSGSSSNFALWATDNFTASWATAPAGPPTTQASGISFNNVTPSSFGISWTRGNGASVAVFMKEGTDPITNPTDGAGYTASTDWNSKGDQLATSGYYAVYNGTGTTVTVTNLLPSTTYTVQAFEYNGTGATTLYLTTPATGNPASQVTAAPPTPYRSKQSGNWNDPATWEVFSGGTWIAATSTPTSSDALINIRTGDIVTIIANVSFDETTIDAGGELRVASGVTATLANGSGTDLVLNGKVLNSGTFTSTGAIITVAATGIYEDAQAATTAAVTIPTATWADSSICLISGLVGQVNTDYSGLAGLNQSFGKFIFNTPYLVYKVILQGAGAFGGAKVFRVENTGPGTNTNQGLQISTATAGRTGMTVINYVQTGGLVQIVSNSSNTTARSMTVTANFSLDAGIFNIANYIATTIGASTLTVQGNLTVAPGAVFGKSLVSTTGTPISDFGTANLALTGAGAQTIVFSSNPTDAVNITVGAASVANLNSSLTINTGATLFITTGGKLNVAATNSLTVAGTANFNNQAVAFKSNLSGAARFGTLTGTLTGSTNVTVERYIPSRRAWRLMNAPFITANTINASWQNGQVYAPGVGTFITGSGAGLDAGNTSMKTFSTATQSLVDVITTNVDIAAQPGYFIFVRGDRDPANLVSPATNATTLSATGTLKTGAQSTTVVKMPDLVTPTFTISGNPYASAIDWAQVTKTNTADRFYVWDPKLAGSFGVGAFVVFDSATGFKPNTGGGSYTTDVPNTFIESSQAFFVESDTDAADGSLGFTEDSKVASNQNVFRTGNGTVEKLNIVLKVQQADNSFTPADGVFGLYENAFSTRVSSEDASKLDNFSENLSIVRNGRRLAIEKRPLIDANDTLFLQLQNTTERNYQFFVTASDFNAPMLSAFVEDSYTGISTPVSLQGNTTVSFAITADAASANADRFRVVFRTSGVLPVSYTSVKAYQHNAGVQLEWKVATESNMRSYEVEKSVDGRRFEKAVAQSATGNNNASVMYNWLDATPFSGTNFYRIKAIDNSGAAKYSQVVNVKIGSSKGEIVLYPNPATGNMISVQMMNKPAGTYTLRLVNNLGQIMFTKTQEHHGGSATETIDAGKLPSGLYQLQVVNGAEMITRQIAIQ